MNTTYTNDTSLYDGAEARGTRTVAKHPEGRGPAATLGEALRRPGYLFTKWPWLALGNIIVGLALSSVLGSVILPLLVISLVPQIRNLLWPALLRVEVWRLRLIDRPGADAIGPPIDRLADEGGTPTFSQFAHLALVIFLLFPFTVGVAFLPVMFTMLFSPWPFFDGTPVEALDPNATDAEFGQGVYDAVIAPLPTWMLVVWMVVAVVVFAIALLYSAGLWAWATGRLGRTLMAPDEEQLRADVDRLESSRADVLDAAAMERARIEGALHDGVQHRLVALTMKLGMAEAEDPEGPTGKLAAEVHGDVDEVLADLRRVIRNIQPRALSEHGLRAAVADLAAEMPMPVDVDVPSVRMPRHIEEAAFFFASEALSNVTKHSGASRATVVAAIDEPAEGADGPAAGAGGERRGTLTLTIADDGRGGAVERAAGLHGSGHGLRGMRQRAAGVDGTVTVTSPDGRGTTVTLICPTRIIPAAADRATVQADAANDTAPTPEEDSRR
ncbi:sensor histidine kinase [Corynebacterium freneyi]|uniref:sensor histidine kinase n=1 Tax=Corynebacterium freneyi TaxID=134034 RepID=UPI001CC96329|nr:histidine kinase [Corynebacterium freneyi]UBI02421.1 histidine kinase [Corynebacterium freneyi]